MHHFPFKDSPSFVSHDKNGGGSLFYLCLWHRTHLVFPQAILKHWKCFTRQIISKHPFFYTLYNFIMAPKLYSTQLSDFPFMNVFNSITYNLGWILGLSYSLTLGTPYQKFFFFNFKGQIFLTPLPHSFSLIFNVFLFLFSSCWISGKDH